MNSTSPQRPIFLKNQSSALNLRRRLSSYTDSFVTFDTMHACLFILFIHVTEQMDWFSIICLQRSVLTRSLNKSSLGLSVQVGVLKALILIRLNIPIKPSLRSNFLRSDFIAFSLCRYALNIPDLSTCWRSVKCCLLLLINSKRFNFNPELLTASLAPSSCCVWLLVFLKCRLHFY